MVPQLSRDVVESVVREVVFRHLETCPKKDDSALPSRLVVNASARHIHVSKQDLETLFGPSHQLTPLRPLYQEGTFAAQETVTLIGPRGRVISNLRILGPLRSQSQVELAFTDAIMLGIENLPMRISGDIDNTPGAFVLGPRGMAELKKGVIRAAMHVHMSPADSRFYGVRHRDVIKLKVGDGPGVTFNQVHVRVDAAFRLEVHMDTDEANACALHMAKQVELLK
ncbi:MAG: phosphate propanoyltransferase [Acidobacteria bacterium]|nr:phosphate propanoyltransferase [Acidobacteriota bacterium]